MSYDFHIYGRIALGEKELKQLLADLGGLRLGDSPGGDSHSYVVKRWTGRYCFTVDGPAALEPEDVPDAWARPEVTHLYSVLVEGSNLEDVSTARSFADLLASRADGTLVNPQQVAPATVSQPSVSAGIPTEEKARLHLVWFRLRDGNPKAAEAYLRSARATCELAVPERFGSHEPMQGRFPRDDDDEFTLLYESACEFTSLFFTNKGIADGTIAGWSPNVRSRLQRVRVTFDLAALEKRGAVESSVDLFNEMAKRSGSFFASAEVNTSGIRTAEPPGFNGGWGGLPRQPQWMTWYSPEYAALVRPYLTSGESTTSASGVFHRWTAEPMRAGDLGRIIGRDPWIAPELLAVVETAKRQRTLAPAQAMPSSLRGYGPGSPEAQRLEAHFAELQARERKQ